MIIIVIIIFAGASPFILNNNGLESANKYIKYVHTFRNKLKFEEFIKVGIEIVQDWSTNSTVLFIFNQYLINFI